uniref:Uncharacterized protein n=1 Tax=Nelumbo nucifera TaxID=4432 RepID=A0A822XL44_NELNU|nr:TPA_asm: hypothetical protein HUJ06_021008 [Nelumbo nucifera]
MSSGFVGYRLCRVGVHLQFQLSSIETAEIELSVIPRPNTDG